MHPCDGQTDGWAIAYYSTLSMLSGANNVWGNRNATQAASLLTLDLRKMAPIIQESFSDV